MQFLGKSGLFVCWRPPGVGVPLLRGILYPPLEAEGLHHLIGRNTCYICTQACFRPLANSSNITFFGISGKARSKVEFAVPLAPSSTIDNARDILAGDKKILVTDVSFRSSL